MVEILTVHYNTPDLLLKLIKSIIKHEGKQYNIRVIDGSGQKYKEVEKFVGFHNNITIEYFAYNIHHGPGLNYGICSSNHPYILCVDSDVEFKKPIVTKMLELVEENYGVGELLELNESIILDLGHDIKTKIKYLHPRCMLINKEMYFKFYPFIKHGAPNILSMADIQLQNQQHVLVHFSGLRDCVDLGGKGTREKFGSCMLGIPHRTLKIRNYHKKQ